MADLFLDNKSSKTYAFCLWKHYIVNMIIKYWTSGEILINGMTPMLIFKINTYNNDNIWAYFKVSVCSKEYENILLYFQTNFFIVGFLSINSFSLAETKNNFKTYMEHNCVKSVKAKLLWLKLEEGHKDHVNCGAVSPRLTESMRHFVRLKKISFIYAPLLSYLFAIDFYRFNIHSIVYS